MSKLNKWGSGVAIALGAFLTVLSGYASAQATDVSSFVDDATTSMTPIILAVAGGLLTLAVLNWGIRVVFRAIRGGGKSAGV